ncbi:LacI family DNA-binding transcriptional regulator [uncultured Jatrophihabitans sp.]|uniref:LacI family DNA-binding transcriptional regulator n=1 Tax=uncultured Jatrophihabitans sp. TaxID=1610747 RepID=UPI0035C97356
MRQRAKRVTLRDVADESGLSPAAVSYALRGLHVPVETQERVRDVAERLGYQVDPIARALASGRTGTIGLLCGSLTDMWQQGMAAELGRGLLRHDRHALIVDASNDPQLERRLAAQLVDQRVDALIVLSVDPTSGHWADIAKRVALVSVGDGIPGAAAEIVFDNAGGVAGALEHLAAAGHRHVAVLTPSSPSTPDRPADAAVAAAAERLGLQIDVHLCEHDLRPAAEVAERVLSATRPPTAVFCLADSMAYGVYAATQRLGLRIPDDVSVLGFDDHQVSRILTPPLSSFRWPLDDLVRSVVERTIKAIDEDKRSRRVVLTPQLQERGSVAPRPTRRRTR